MTIDKCDMCGCTKRDESYPHCWHCSKCGWAACTDYDVETTLEKSDRTVSISIQQLAVLRKLLCDCLSMVSLDVPLTKKDKMVIRNHLASALAQLPKT